MITSAFRSGSDRVDRSSFTAATVVEMFLEDIERTADDCLSQSAEFAVLPDIGVVIFPDVAVREALAEVGEPMLAQQAPGGHSPPTGSAVCPGRMDASRPAR